MAEKRIKIVSSIPPKQGWIDLAKYTCATQERYALKHGYSYHLDYSDVWKPRSTPWVDQRAEGHSPLRTMIKFPLLQHFLTPERCRETWDYVAWIDADCLVTNYDIPLTRWTSNGVASIDDDDPLMGDVITAWDVNTLHPTVIIMRATTLTRGLVWACSEAGDRMYREHGWSDIMALKFMLMDRPYRDLHWQHSARDLCAMPPGVHPMPDDVNRMYSWTPESWTLHLSALSLEKRLEIAKDYCDRLGLLA